MRVTNRTSAVACLGVTLTLAAAACSPGEDVVARAGIDPVGAYEFVLIDDGERISGSMEISGSPGAYTGVIRADGRPDGTISTVTTGGYQLTVTSDFPGMILLARLQFEGDSFSGDWSMRGEGGAIEGRRVVD